MSTTLTIRTDASLRKRLDERAAAAGKSVSEFVREILEKELADRPLAARTGHLKARLALPARPEEPWRRKLRDRNWRP
jgi:plasmid stability protein